MSRRGRASLALVILAAALVLSLGLAVSVGSMAIAMGDVYRVMAYGLFGLGDSSTWGSGGVHDVVWLIRLPRLVLAAAIGAGLGLCGAVMQAMVQNTMADPYILGGSSGAYLGAALALTAGAGTALGGNAMGLAGAVGAFLAAAAVLRLARLGGRSTPFKLLLSGVALGAVCSALGNFCSVLENDDHAAAALVQWTMGGMGAASWPGNAIACGVIDTEMNACFSEEERAELADEIALMRFGKPEEVGRFALTLANKSASFLTGQIITLDGGML